MGAAPTVRGPRDVPELRNWMITEWFPGGAFALTAGQHVLSAVVAAAEGDGYEAEVDKVIAWNLFALRDAELWYVDAAMVDLIESSSEDVPVHSMQLELAPSERPTLVCFERPVQGSDAVTGNEGVRVDGFLWGWSENRVYGPCLSMTLYARLNFDEGLGASELKLAAPWIAHSTRGMTPGGHRLHDEIWVPLGRTDWVIGKSWDWQHPLVSDTVHRSTMEDRRWLTTLWSLAAEPRIVDRTQFVPDRATRRRAQRAGAAAPEVTVINLRQAVYQGAGASRTQTGERTYHVRWPVRGHWRNQPYGPGRRYRRPTYIAPYIKGPGDAPLKKGATVRVLRDERS
jgi:hypothetical protein